MLDPAEALGAGGRLSRLIKNFNPRAQQREMAAAVARVIEDRGVLICEAGTGTGKTFAYLVPALLSGRRVVISTGTKQLQEQLFSRDLPLIRDALGVTAHCVLLKGRANYLCRHRLEVAAAAPGSPEEAGGLEPVRAWASGTRTGDIAELTSVPESSAIWRTVTSTVDNCLGQECPRFDDCHVLAARRDAMEADVVIVNHHLFFADLALRERGFGELLPSAEAVVLDEAHLLPDVASRFFGASFSVRQLLGLGRDALAAQRAEARDLPEFAPLVSAMERATRELRLAFGVGSRRVAWAEARELPRVTAAVLDLQHALAALAGALDELAERGPDLAASGRRARELAGRVDGITGPEGDDVVSWIELTTSGFIWHLTPLEVGELFAAHLERHHCAWVFTSATLSVRGEFDHFARRMGLRAREDRQWASPFDFTTQAVCYLPDGLPEPRDPGYTARVVDAAAPVLAASRGRAFFLFTSYRALEEAYERLRDRIAFPLLVQGAAPRSELLRRFRALGDAVLLGTASFWQGVDVRGDALSCVIIDKLPFEAPGDPLLKARLAKLRDDGLDPFLDYQLPQAVITLRQGAGRLIRDTTDRGVLMLCDPRLSARGYGRAFIESLPPIPITRDLGVVVRFFDESAAEGNPGR